MAQLTGTFQGTSRADSYLGEVFNEDLVLMDVRLTGIAALDVDIQSLGGADRIEALVDIGDPAGFDPLRGIGILNGDLATGAGKDRVVANTSVVSTSQAFSIGFQNVSLDTDRASDIVEVFSKAEASALTATFASASGLDESRVKTGNGQDQVTVSVESVGVSGQGGGVSIATGLINSTIATEGGWDTISVDANSRSGGGGGGRFVSYGVLRSTITGGNGRDTIAINVTGSSGGPVAPGGIAEGMSLSSINGDNGHDNIAVKVDVQTGGGPSDQVLFAYGVSDGASLLGGSGQDVIDVDVQGVGGNFGSSRTLVAGVYRGLLDGGFGKDRINIQAAGSLVNGIVSGVLTATVRGDSGADFITIEAKLLDPNPGVSTPPVLSPNADVIGVVSSTVDGGNGADTFVVRGVNLDIQDAVITGGAHRDTFDTGLGSGDIDGGTGRDLIKLDFFDQTTMTVELLATDSIQITGTQDKLGNASDWLQTISGVEQYEVNGTVYSAAEVVNLLS